MLNGKILKSKDCPKCSVAGSVVIHAGILEGEQGEYDEYACEKGCGNDGDYWFVPILAKNA